MEQQTAAQAARPDDRIEPVVLPDVATEPHPRTHSAATSGNVPDVGPDLLQGILPEIHEVARKVGGFKRLSEIASQLDRSEVGK